MSMKRSALRAGAVLAVALAAGHLVQTMYAERAQTATTRTDVPKKIEKVSAGPETAAETAAAPALPDPALPAAASLAPAPVPDAPATPPPAPAELAALTDVTPALPPLPLLPALPMLAPPVDKATAPEAPPAPAAAPDCTPALSLAAAPGAILAVTLRAPCAAGARVVLRHAGLAVAESLDSSGQLALDLPALAVSGEVSALFGDGTVLMAATAVPEAAATRRFAVQWMAGDTFQLRVVGPGQAYGDAENVSAEMPVSAQGGFLVSLGDPTLDLPMLAQVYTWPGDPALTAAPVVEAAVTDATCGRELLGETILAENGKVTVTDLTVAMPGCDALGDILVLNNLAGDVTLAAQN